MIRHPRPRSLFPTRPGRHAALDPESILFFSLLAERRADEAAQLDAARAAPSAPLPGISFETLDKMFKGLL